MNRMNKLLIALCVLAPLVHPINVLSPVSADISDGSVISFGAVGPGQTFAVLAEPKLSTGGRYGLGGSYDRLFPSELPEGWAGNPSKLYASSMQADVTVPKDAIDGEYLVGFTLWDEAGNEGLGQNVTFSAKVTVKSDVMDMRVEPSFLSVGAGQPARYTITILNKGIANDIFTVSSSGVSDWEFHRSIYVPSGTSKSLSYEIVGNEESDYRVKLTARSASSDRISSSSEVSLRVSTDLFSDWRAVNRGVLLFPLTEAPLYFVTGLLSNLFS